MKIKVNNILALREKPLSAIFICAYIGSASERKTKSLTVLTSVGTPFFYE